MALMKSHSKESLKNMVRTLNRQEIDTLASNFMKLTSKDISKSVRALSNKW